MIAVQLDKNPQLWETVCFLRPQELWSWEHEKNPCCCFPPLSPHTHTHTHTPTHYLFLALEERPEKAMAPHSSTLARKIPWMEEPGRLQSMGSLRVGHDWATSLSRSCIGEGNGNPLQCSCLENTRDREAWWAVVYRVAQSWTRLKRLSSSSSNPLWAGSMHSGLVQRNDLCITYILLSFQHVANKQNSRTSC